MINSSISVDQEKRQRQELKTVSSESNESKLNTDLYSDGYFTGYIGCEPTQPENYSYWAGYQLGSREYWAERLGVEIATEF